MVGGPHVSSDGRAETIEEMEIGMLLCCALKVCVHVPVGQSSATLSNRDAYAKLITALNGFVTIEKQPRTPFLRVVD